MSETTDAPGPECIDGAKNAPRASVVYVASVSFKTHMQYAFWLTFAGVLLLAIGVACLMATAHGGWVAVLDGVLVGMVGVALILRASRSYRKAHGIRVSIVEQDEET